MTPPKGFLPLTLWGWASRMFLLCHCHPLPTAQTNTFRCFNPACLMGEQWRELITEFRDALCGKGPRVLTTLEYFMSLGKSTCRFWPMGLAGSQGQAAKEVWNPWFPTLWAGKGLHFPREDMVAANIGKEKTGGYEGCDLWSLIPQGSLIVLVRGWGTAGDSIWERWILKLLEGAVAGGSGQTWCQPRAPEELLHHCFQRLKQDPSPAFSIGTPQRQKRRFYIPPLPFKYTYPSHFCIVCSHHFLQLLSHLFPMSTNRT